MASLLDDDEPNRPLRLLSYRLQCKQSGVLSSQNVFHRRAGSHSCPIAIPAKMHRFVLSMNITCGLFATLAVCSAAWVPAGRSSQDDDVQQQPAIDLILNAFDSHRL